jgi:hypothetical protein
MTKMSVELEVEQYQELLFTARKKANDIDWVLENRYPTKPGQAKLLDDRAKMLTITAMLIEKALNERALTNVVKIATKKTGAKK